MDYSALATQYGTQAYQYGEQAYNAINQFDACAAFETFSEVSVCATASHLTQQVKELAQPIFTAATSIDPTTAALGGAIVVLGAGLVHTNMAMASQQKTINSLNSELSEIKTTTSNLISSHLSNLITTNLKTHSLGKAIVELAIRSQMQQTETDTLFAEVEELQNAKTGTQQETPKTSPLVLKDAETITE